MDRKPNPEISKKCPVKTGLGVQSESELVSSTFRIYCPVQIGIGVQFTPDFAKTQTPAIMK